MERRQALALALAALCAAMSEPGEALTWQTFDEAKTEQECRAAYEQMNSLCGFAAISGGKIQNANGVKRCQSDARNLRDKCVSKVIKAREEAAAEAEEKAAEAEQKEARAKLQEERAQIRRKISGKHPSLVLGCSRRGGSDSFPSTFEFLVFQDLSVCVLDGMAHDCSLSAAEFRGTVDRYQSWDDWRISRVTGEMSMERVYMQRNADRMQASYRCDKVTPGATKF